MKRNKTSERRRRAQNIVKSAKKPNTAEVQVALHTGRMAQRIRRLTSNQQIGGSNPSVVDFF